MLWLYFITNQMTNQELEQINEDDFKEIQDLIDN